MSFDVSLLHRVRIILSVDSRHEAGAHSFGFGVNRYREHAYNYLGSDLTTVPIFRIQVSAIHFPSLQISCLFPIDRQTGPIGYSTREDFGAHRPTRGAKRCAIVHYDETSQYLNPAARGDAPSSRIDSELDAALRENIKLSEEMLTLIKSDQGNDICEQLTVLSALRSADTDSSTSRATNPGKSRDRGQNKRKLTDAAMDDRDSIAADSPAVPSPKVILGKDRDRLLNKNGGSRAGSVPAVRESSVKAEEEKDEPTGKKKRSSTVTYSKKGGGSGSR